MPDIVTRLDQYICYTRAEVEHIEQLIHESDRRRRILELRCMKQRENTPPEVITELEDIYSEVFLLLLKHQMITDRLAERGE